MIRSLRPRVALALLLLGFLWGFSFLLIKIVVVEIGPVLLAAGRIWTAVLILLPVVLLTRGSISPRPARIRDIAVAGLLNYTLPYILIPFGETMIPTGHASVLNATMPIFTVLIAWGALRQRPTLRIAAGVALGFVGVTFLTGEAPTGLRGSQIPGQAAVLAAAFLYAVAAHWMHRRLAGLDPLATTFLTLAAAAVFITPAALVAGPARVAGISLRALSAWVALGAVCTAFAYLLFFYILKTGGALAASFSTYLFTVFALFWGWLLLGEPLDTATLAGTACVFAGIFLAGGR